MSTTDTGSNDSPTAAPIVMTTAAAPTSMSVNSTSDSRVVNNVMRHEYRVLSQIEKDMMQKLKDVGLELHNLLHEIGQTAQTGQKFASRELSLAATKIEEGIMWGVKHITR